MKTLAMVLLLPVACVLLALAAMVAGVLLRNGDVIWLGAVIAMTWAWCALVFRGGWRVVPIAVGTAVIAAHMAGWKMYGRPLLDTTPVLEHALALKDIAPPNVVIAADGSRHELRGFFMVPGFVDLAESERREILTWLCGDLRFCPDPSMPSGYVAERRITGWCGNTWDPQLLPRKVSAYKIDDLGFSLSNVLTHIPPP